MRCQIVWNFEHEWFGLVGYYSCHLKHESTVHNQWGECKRSWVTVTILEFTINSLLIWLGNVSKNDLFFHKQSFTFLGIYARGFPSNINNCTYCGMFWSSWVLNTMLNAGRTKLSKPILRKTIVMTNHQSRNTTGHNKVLDLWRGVWLIIMIILYHRLLSIMIDNSR